MMNNPIDPTDVLALERVANTALTGWVRLHDMKRINTETLTALQTVIPAVARAVLPDGYVAVPVEEIAKAVEIMTWGTQGTSEEQDTKMYFRSLLPEENER